MVAVNKKPFYSFEYMSHFKKLIEDSPSNEKFYISLTEKKVIKRMNMFLRFGLDLK